MASIGRADGYDVMDFIDAAKVGVSSGDLRSSF